LILPLAEWKDNDISITSGDTQQAVDLATYADHVEKIVLDLYVGSAFYIVGPDAGKELAPDSKLLVRPGEAIRIKTREVLHVGSAVFGQLCSRSSLTSKGLVVSHIKIDPKFNGRLTVTVFNVGKASIEVPRENGFCSLFFQQISQSVNGATRTPPEDPNRKGAPAREWMARNWRAVITVMISLVISVSGSVIAAHLTAEHNSNRNQPRPTPTIPTTTTIRLRGIARPIHEQGRAQLNGDFDTMGAARVNGTSVQLRARA
jgi:deoxycytidine triphosphate deaminase